MLNGVIYGSSKIQTKNCDSCFRSKDGKLGITEFFISLNNKFYVCAKNWSIDQYGYIATSSLFIIQSLFFIYNL